MSNQNNSPEDQILVIFGATGDLTRRKLMPALFELEMLKMLPEKFVILGVGRSSISDIDFREHNNKSLKDAYSSAKDQKLIKGFLERLFYLQADTKSEESYIALRKKLQLLRKKSSMQNFNLIFYLSTPPSLYEVIPRLLAKASLNDESEGWKRIIIEKPFGYDLKSAVELNESLKKSWKENQVFRIDHYLGKETVQNVLVTRFSNGIFEPLWNRNFIHHVEITSAENFGVGNRAGYYDQSGALRDMVQNHLLQLVGLIAMEPPASMDSDAIRNETVKVLQSLRPLSEKDVVTNTIRGQYTESTIKGHKVKAYRSEKGISSDSQTETYAALKFYIDNWRWGGVPFYLRTGKHLPTRVTEVVIHFKPTPHYLFAKQEGCKSCNQLIIRIQPDEGILLKFGMKTPGAGFNVQNVSMDFHYNDLSDVRIPDAYERLLLDAMIGDSTLYARIDAVFAAWEFIQPVLDGWKNNASIPLHGYPAGTWGPDIADELIEEADIGWRYPCAALTGDDNFCAL
ncbi:MAG: glucose-6-phosphate dehydrogenase [Bacteroidetes bacterium]|nr:MAG: glucose-6-phosphate dehydrogenase [Bacteroidota bacterium]